MVIFFFSPVKRQIFGDASGQTSDDDDDDDDDDNDDDDDDDVRDN